MGFIEERISPSAFAALDKKSRTRLQMIEAQSAQEGVALCQFLIRCFQQNWRTKSAVAAVAIDELALQLTAARRDSAVPKEIATLLPTLRNWQPRKKMPAELRINAVCALVELQILSAKDAREFLAEQLKHECWEDYSNYTLARMTVLFGQRRRERLQTIIRTRFAQSSELEKIQVLLRMSVGCSSFVGGVLTREELWAEVRHGITKERLALLPTAALVLLLQVRRKDSGSAGEIEAVTRLLGRRDRGLYSYFTGLATSAYSISRREQLQELVSSELAMFPPNPGEAPAVLSEFAKYGVLPMRYLASSIKPLLEEESELNFIQRMQILTALVSLGVVDPTLVKRVFEALQPQFSIKLPFMLFMLPDAVWTFAICDLLHKSNYTEQLLDECKEMLSGGYQEFDDRERMRIGRAAYAVDYQLPWVVRHSLRRIEYQIKNNPPTTNASEKEFIAALQEALPEAKVSAGGFAGTHHLDATVCLNGQCYDAELDGRVHEVFDLLGRRVGTIGADILRDKLVSDDGFCVVRFTRTELEGPEFKSLVRKRFGLT